MTRRVAAGVIAAGLILAGLGVSVSRADSPDAGTVREALAGIVRREQRANVRESYGELAYECFTWVDLDNFKRARTDEKVARRLRDDRGFLRGVDMLRALSPGDRASVLAACRKPLRPTWREQGHISPSGTTDAGQIAERLIASAIVQLAADLSGSAGASPVH